MSKCGCQVHYGEKVGGYDDTIAYCLLHANAEQLWEALDTLKHFCIDRMNAASDPAQGRVFDRAANIAEQALTAARMP